MNKLRDQGAQVIALGVIIVVAAAVVVWQGLVWFDAKRHDDRRADAVAVAEAQVLDLTTMAPATVKDQLDAMSKRLTGDFKRQFEGFASTFAGAVATDRITSEGKVVGTAVSEYDDEESATVLVASSAQVRQDKGKTTERYWRFRVVLDRSDDQWLISGMEFVQ